MATENLNPKLYIHMYNGLATMPDLNINFSKNHKSAEFFTKMELNILSLYPIQKNRFRHFVVFQ